MIFLFSQENHNTTGMQVKRQMTDRKAIKRTYSVKEAATILGVNAKGVYTDIRNGRFVAPHTKVGKRILIPRAPLHELLGEPYEADLLSRPARSQAAGAEK